MNLSNATFIHTVGRRPMDNSNPNRGEAKRRRKLVRRGLFTSIIHIEVLPVVGLRLTR